MRKKNYFIIGIVLALIIAAVIWILISKPGDSETSGYFEYPIKAGDSEWGLLGGAGRLEACRIPEDQLEAMSDEQLVQAIADFPMLSEVLMAAIMEYGVANLSDQSDAYKELLTRKNGKSALISKIKALEEKEDKTTDEIVIEEVFQLILLHEKSFTLTEEEQE